MAPTAPTTTSQPRRTQSRLTRRPRRIPSSRAAALNLEVSPVKGQAKATTGKSDAGTQHETVGQDRRFGLTP